MTFEIKDIQFDDACSMQFFIRKTIESLHEIGDGLYAKVYSNSTVNFAIKVIRKYDAGYHSWITAIKNVNSASRYLPLIEKGILQ